MGASILSDEWKLYVKIATKAKKEADPFLEARRNVAPSATSASSSSAAAGGDEEMVTTNESLRGLKIKDICERSSSFVKVRERNTDTIINISLFTPLLLHLHLLQPLAEPPRPSAPATSVVVEGVSAFWR